MLTMLLLIFCHHCAAFSLPTVHDFHFLVLYLIWRLRLISPSQVATGTGPPAPNVRFYDVLMCAKKPLVFFKMNRKPFVFLHARTPARAPVHRRGAWPPRAKKRNGSRPTFSRAVFRRLAKYKKKEVFAAARLDVGPFSYYLFVTFSLLF